MISTVHLQAALQDPERSLDKQILDLIRRKQFAEADTRITKMLAADRHDYQAHLLRKALATGYIQASMPEKANAEYERLISWLVKHPAESRPMLKHVGQILVNHSGIRSGVEPTTTRLLTPLIERLQESTRENPANVAWSIALSATIGFQARSLLKQGKISAVANLYEAELSRLRKKWRANLENPDSWLRLSYFLRAAAEPRQPEYQSRALQYQLERENLLAAGVARFPQSDAMIVDFVASQQNKARSYDPVDPAITLEVLRKLERRLAKSLETRERTTKLINTRIQLAREIQQRSRAIVRQQLPNRPFKFDTEVDWLTPRQSPPDRNAIVVLFAGSREADRKTVQRLRDWIYENRPDLKLIATTTDPGTSFTDMTLVKRKRADDYEQQVAVYRESLLKELAAGKSAIDLGIVTAPRDLADRLGVDKTPFAIVIDGSGVCTGSFRGRDLFELLIDSVAELENNPK